MPDYSVVDHPPFLESLFFPRSDYTACPLHGLDFPVTVAKNVSISCRFYIEDKRLPTILYFHGNGEVVSDHDQISLLYNRMGFNLVVADYRGYGKSGGVPTFTNLINDAHLLFEVISKELQKRVFSNNLWLMGRSLGSISALELSYHYQKQLKGTIIESGFTSVVRLIKNWGLAPLSEGLITLEKQCLAMISQIYLPVLVIHGQYDNLVPLQEGRDLYERLASPKKEMVIIPYADHNNLMLVGLKQYFDAIARFTTAESE